MCEKDGTNEMVMREVKELYEREGAACIGLSEAELSEMIDKANPEQQGNAALKLDDFLALMAQASGITRCCGMPDPRATPY